MIIMFLLTIFTMMAAAGLAIAVAFATAFIAEVGATALIAL